MIAAIGVALVLGLFVRGLLVALLVAATVIIVVLVDVIPSVRKFPIAQLCGDQQNLPAVGLAVTIAPVHVQVVL